MKYGLMTDIHFGLKKDSKIILDWQMKAFYKSINVFKKNNVDSIIILGDVFDNRKKNSTYIIHKFRKEFLEPLARDFNDVYFIIGNHDMYYRNKRECNIISEIVDNRYKNVHVIDNITRINNILMIPWICKDSDISHLIREKKNGGIAIGHLEISGFRMTSSDRPCDRGINSSLFNNFDLVISGHFHLREKIKNIQYLGTMIGLSWAEYHGDHGVHILNSETKILDFYPLNINMFSVMKFENKIYTTEELEKYRNKIVKIFVDEGEDGLFDNLINKLSSICFSYSKQYISKSENYSNDSYDDEYVNFDIESEDSLFNMYLEECLPEHIESSVFTKIYKKVRSSAERSMVVTK